MQETVTCPSCLARYELRAIRVHLGIKRARCFKCNHIFDIEQSVKNLLQKVLLETPLSVRAEPLGPPQPVPPSYDTTALTQTQAEALDESHLAVEDDKLALTEPILGAPLTPVTPAPLEPPPVVSSPSLSTPPKSEGSGFSSAKDAIFKLLGTGHSSPETSPTENRHSGRTTKMDMDATLDALDNTFGSIHPGDIPDTPAAPHPPAHAEHPSLGTVKLSTEEIKAAMTAGLEHNTTPSPAPIAPAPKVATAPPVSMPPLPTSSTAHGEDLLRVKAGNEFYQHLTQEKLIKLIEEGQVHDWHLVARQHSENWIEAGKIPALRHTFEEVRRKQLGTEAPQESAPAKKGLFAGLFGRH